MSTHIKLVISLSIGLLVVFGWHFGTVFGYFGTAPETKVEFFTRIAIILALFLIASIVTSTIISKNDEHAALPDERDEKIELKAERNGMFVIYAGLLCLMWFAFTPMTPMQFANGILAVVCFTEIVKIISGIYYLRSGV